jgi:hypothetical protein
LWEVTPDIGFFGDVDDDGDYGYSTDVKIMNPWFHIPDLRKNLQKNISSPNKPSNF